MSAPMTPERLTEIRACDAEMTDILLVVRPAVRHRRELLAEVDRLSAQTAVVVSFLAERADFLRAIGASPNADADYWRWQGHAESRRHLSERLAALDSGALGLWTVPDHLIGDLT